MKKDEETLGTIYIIVCIVTGMIYVGQTTSTLSHRFSQHIYDAYQEKCQGPNRRLCAAIREFGKDSFIIVPLVENVPESQLRKLESDWILKLHASDPMVGYNFQDGRRVYYESEYDSEWYAAKLAKMSPEELAEFRKKEAERANNWYHSMTDEERKEYNLKKYQHEKAKKETMTEEEKAEARRKHAEKMRKWRAKKKAAEGQAELDNFNTDNV